MQKILFIAILLLALSSCELLKQTAQQVIEQNKPLTKEQVAKGLKSALHVGVDTAIVQLSQENGYYKNPQLRIPLPEETSTITSYARKIPGVQSIIDDLEMQLNRSAEDAAKQAGVVFAGAIRNMTINDAMGILNGPDDAATNYLKEQTQTALSNAYRPIIDASMSKALVGNVSANSSWDDLRGKWNSFTNSYAGKLLNLQPVNYDLTQYVTEQAIEGLFHQIKLEEKDIRNNADARVNDILKRVFGNQSGTLTSLSGQ